MAGAPRVNRVPVNGHTIQLEAKNPSHNYRIASIPADRIGQEVISAVIEVVTQLSKTPGTFKIEFNHIPCGTAYYKMGKYIDDDVLEVLKSYDVSLFGSVGAPGKF
jgi:isocitrate/isopropylmalate dehydrogenase